MTKYIVARMFNVESPDSFKNILKDIPFSSLTMARIAAKNWCMNSKSKYKQRAAVIAIQFPSGVPGFPHSKVIETYVEDTGGSGKAVQTRKYNTETKKSRLI